MCQTLVSNNANKEMNMIEVGIEKGIVCKREIVDILSTLSVVVLLFTIRKPLILILGGSADFMERKKSDVTQILAAYIKPIK